MTAELLFTAACLAVVGAAGAALLGWLAFVRPRIGLYCILALAPTQFIFIPVRDFFLSPADVLVLAGAAGLALRLAGGRAHAWMALRHHVFIGVMIAAYLVGFIVLDHFSRTLIRLPLAVVPSVLACELLRERRHLARGLAALVIAGFVDAGYGTLFLAVGERLHPTRFSGMMGVNFSAIVIISAAAIAFARLGRTRQPITLLIPGALAVLGVATLSKAGILALTFAWVLVLSFVVSRGNRQRVAIAAAAIVIAAFTQDAVRQRVFARAHPELQLDGVYRTSTDVRVLILRSAWEAFGEQPLVGVGYFNFERYSNTDPEIRASTAGIGYATHNSYLEVLVEGGLLAFVPFVLHFGSIAVRLRWSWYALTRHHDVLVGAAIAALIVVLFSAAVANVLLHFLFWSICGVALACLIRLPVLAGADAHPRAAPPARP